MYSFDFSVVLSPTPIQLEVVYAATFTPDDAASLNQLALCITKDNILRVDFIVFIRLAEAIIRSVYNDERTNLYQPLNHTVSLTVHETIISRGQSCQNTRIIQHKFQHQILINRTTYDTTFILISSPVLRHGLCPGDSNFNFQKTANNIRIVLLFRTRNTSKNLSLDVFDPSNASSWLQERARFRRPTISNSSRSISAHQCMCRIQDWAYEALFCDRIPVLRTAHKTLYKSTSRQICKYGRKSLVLLEKLASWRQCSLYAERALLCASQRGWSTQGKSALFRGLHGIHRSTEQGR